MFITISHRSSSIFRFLVLSDQQSNTEINSIYRDFKHMKAANPNFEAGTRTFFGQCCLINYFNNKLIIRVVADSVSVQSLEATNHFSTRKRTEKMPSLSYVPASSQHFQLYSVF